MPGLEAPQRAWLHGALALSAFYDNIRTPLKPADAPALAEVFTMLPVLGPLRDCWGLLTSQRRLNDRSSMLDLLHQRGVPALPVRMSPTRGCCSRVTPDGRWIEQCGHFRAEPGACARSVGREEGRDCRYAKAARNEATPSCSRYCGCWPVHRRRLSLHDRLDQGGLRCPCSAK